MVQTSLAQTLLVDGQLSKVKSRFAFLYPNKGRTLSAKISQLVDDPILRRWLAARILGRESPVPEFEQGQPPYLAPYGWQTQSFHPGTNGVPLPPLRVNPPSNPLEVMLPGVRIKIKPGDVHKLLDRTWDDIEKSLAVHRFAWLPLAGSNVEPGWVDTIWRSWSSRHGKKIFGWAWHPYTAAERVINILDFARRVGLPGDSADTRLLLSVHGQTILRNLEYNGDHYTSNHLSNNGRGLFLLGLALGIEAFADIGGKILIEEASRIFAPSGILREGSSHYHLLLTRNYVSAWLAAETHDRPEASLLRTISGTALRAASTLILSGGLPLIGDISPDCPPEFLTCLLPNNDIATGWGTLLSEPERGCLRDLKSEWQILSDDHPIHDDWHRYEDSGWSALWHIAPNGWAPMPGHGHQDIGSFELHHDGERVVIDLGRGRYCQHGDGDYVSAERHNGITVDGREPYPPNRPYYSRVFRERIGGSPPTLERLNNGVRVSFDGYRRMPGLGQIKRTWTFVPDRMIVDDHVEGHGSHHVWRRINTFHTVRSVEHGVVIETPRHTYHLHGDGKFQLTPATAWSAYGEGRPATTIEILLTTNLPVDTRLALEVISNV